MVEVQTENHLLRECLHNICKSVLYLKAFVDDKNQLNINCVPAFSENLNLVIKLPVFDIALLAF